jgi:hypothetical protein
MDVQARNFTTGVKGQVRVTIWTSCIQCARPILSLIKGMLEIRERHAYPEMAHIHPNEPS